MRSATLSVITVLLLAFSSGASAQTLSAPAAPPQICSGGGNLTLTGTVPKGNGSSTYLRIGIDSPGVTLVVNDATKSIQQMAPVSQHLGSVSAFVAAVNAIPAPTTPAQTLAQIAASQQRVLVDTQNVVQAQSQMQPVLVNSNGSFTCQGLRPGAYTLIAQVVQKIKTKSSQEKALWGPYQPNQLLERAAFRVGAFKTKTTVPLPAKFTTLASFGQ